MPRLSTTLPTTWNDPVDIIIVQRGAKSKVIIVETSLVAFFVWRMMSCMAIPPQDTTDPPRLQSQPGPLRNGLSTTNMEEKREVNQDDSVWRRLEAPQGHLTPKLRLAKNASAFFFFWNALMGCKECRYTNIKNQCFFAFQKQQSPLKRISRSSSSTYQGGTTMLTTTTTTVLCFHWFVFWCSHSSRLCH